MSLPRSSRANRICHMACLPLPKQVIVCTLCLLLKIIVAASAVLNAVNSSALMTATGRPEPSSSVKMPLGVVPDELATDAGGWNEVPLILEAELLLVLGDGESEMPLIAEGSDAVDSLFNPGASGVFRAIIFIPRDSPVLAGMNNVVTPFLLMMVRGG